jgi:hypothetical protein
MLASGGRSRGSLALPTIAFDLRQPDVVKNST